MQNNFLPTASIETLKRRSALLSQVRRFFHSNGYWEVETPILSQDTVVDAYLDPFVLSSTNNQPEMFLQTSPEFAMKRLVAAGADRIYQIAKVFRQGEAGKRHNPEFTMAEWYAVNETFHQQMDFVEAMFRSVAKLPATPFHRLTYDEAFESSIGVRPMLLNAEELKSLADKHAVSIPNSLDTTDVDSLLNLLLAELVEPNLGRSEPAFVVNYPANQAALAKVNQDSTDGPPVAERFELYIDGIEFCNGYQELTDADELRIRIHRENKIRQREGFRPLPVDSRLLAAMESGLPDCSGVALGIDRLAMWLFKAGSIRDVLAFPFDQA